MLKFLVKVFICLYLLNMSIDQFGTMGVGRYWSEFFFCAITIHLGDLEKCSVKVFINLNFLNT